MSAHSLAPMYPFSLRVRLPILRRVVLFLGLLTTIVPPLWAQGITTKTVPSTPHFWIPSDTFHTKRFNTALGISGGLYVGFSIGLYKAWYAQYPQSHFRLFNDWGEWQHMDKIGHVYSTYFQGLLCYKGAKWTGLSEKKAIWTGITCGLLFQSTIEMMDGFSEKWGFSVSDMGANVGGIALFALQQKHWGEQRITLKVSSTYKQYSTMPIPSTDDKAFSSIDDRAQDLFGSNFFERYLKDYNAQIYWASFNIRKLLGTSDTWPAWLNIAVGYSGENLFGGFENIWTEDTHTFRLSQDLYPRYSQFYVGFDLDLNHLNPSTPFLKTICSVFNIFKVPSPAIEINTRGEVHFHLFR